MLNRHGGKTHRNGNIKQKLNNTFFSERANPAAAMMMPIIGAVVGAVLLIIILILVVVCCISRRKQQKSTTNHPLQQRVKWYKIDETEYAEKVRDKLIWERDLLTISDLSGAILYLTDSVKGVVEDIIPMKRKPSKKKPKPTPPDLVKLVKEGRNLNWKMKTRRTA